MATSKIHTFEEILEKGITIPNEPQQICIDKIVIPRIQRAYAQGRKSEQEVRQTILDDIFNFLCADEEQILELSFLFGSKQPVASGGYGFELLDGQQRITTLFLLYWYLWSKEKGSAIPGFLKKFTYETRDTATQFINNIVEKTIVIDEGSPSKKIKSLKWFTEVFNCDATVCAMLTMLDAIDEKYKDVGCCDLYGKLHRLRFYVLYLDEFELNDELYIKMNSRGLDLTPFENFKAALIRFMKKGDGRFSEDVSYNGVKMPFYLRFSTKMDTVWSDIFFSLPQIPSGDVTHEVVIDNKEKDTKFFRFIVRYFFTQLILLFEEQEADYKSLEDFFYKNSQKDNEYSAESPHSLEVRLTGWDNFEKVLQKVGYEGLCKLEKILDVFASFYADDIKKAINSYPFGAQEDWNVFDEYKKFTLPNRVVFAVIVEFIARIPKYKTFNDLTIQKNLKKMLRVMWNVIENTKIEDIVSTKGVIKALVETVKQSGAVDMDYYASIANLKSRNNQLNEEISKAKAISNNLLSDQAWESAFIEAESHPFFKGMIRFFYDENIPISNEFRKRYKIISELFDERGIANAYRQNGHILIRALISQMNSWDGFDGLGGKYITENAEKEGYLKILLGTAGAKKLFCGFFNTDGENINAYLKQVVANAEWGNKNELGKARVFTRLVNDRTTSELLDNMFKIESNRKKQFHIVNSCSVILACIPYNERIVLDTERHLIIKKMVKENGFSFYDSNQKADMDSALEDAWGWDIIIQKELNDSKNNKLTLFVQFDSWRKVIFEISLPNSNQSFLTSNSDYEPIAGGKWRYKKTILYDSLNDYENIIEQVKIIENHIVNQPDM